MGGKRRTQENIDSLDMGQEREEGSCRKEAEDLRREKRETKEAFGARLKNILERIKKKGKDEKRRKKDGRRRERRGY